MSPTNDIFLNRKGNGLALFYQKPPIDASSEQWTEDARQVGKYQNYKNTSLISTSLFKQKGGGNNSVFVKSSLNINNDDDVNNTSLVSIIEYLQKWRATYVTFADFAYLKNLGVYPTNRLIIARRFPSPVGNNLYQVDADPISTLISWVPDNTDFISISFKENWTEGEASFKEIFDAIGKDLGFKQNLGEFAAGGGNVFALGGISDYLQKKIGEKLGITEDPDNPPAGNPNLIKQSQRRELVPKDKGGAGLEGGFTINFTTEYEQKFINGVDPSEVYLDIIQKILMFGTSHSQFVFNGTFGKEGLAFDALKRGDNAALQKALTDLVKALVDALIEISTEYGSQGAQGPQAGSQAFWQFAIDSFANVLKKYRVMIYSVFQALTGSPSGYWHVTVGNPRKPIFCSGDLICGQVTLTFGKTLSYNDLPSSIKVSFEMKPARNLGGQELFDRLNTGQGRKYYQLNRSYIDQIGNTSSDAQQSETYEDKRWQRFEEDLRNNLSSKGFPEPNSGNPGPQL